MTYVMATHNKKKREEMTRILEPLGITVITPPLAEAEETGTTFAENAFLKAHAACQETGLPAIADDSGLMVDALDGAPGVYSARYAGEGADDAARNRKLLRVLEGVPREQRTARFVCAVCCVLPDGQTVEAQGICEGHIGMAPAGEDGFGYDPLFEVADGRTYAQLSAAEKDVVSHRGKAMRQFAERLRSVLSASSTHESNHKGEDRC